MKKTVAWMAAVAAIFFYSTGGAVAQCLSGCSTSTTVTYGAGSIAGALGASRGLRTRSTSGTYTDNGGSVKVTPQGVVRGYVFSSGGAYQSNTAYGRRGSGSFSASGVAGSASVTVTRSRVPVNPQPPGGPN
tara:strand:- start:12999 stop:13394 length:396 start_codon:yes stop_codon:yes gene_type:complete